MREFSASRNRLSGLPQKLWSDEQNSAETSFERRSLRIVLFTSDSTRILLALHENFCTVVLTVTPVLYRPVGKPVPGPLAKGIQKVRRYLSGPSPLESVSAELFLPLTRVWSLNDPKLRSQLTKLKPDLFVVAGYPEIFSEELLAIPRLGTLNLHASLLPRYRGPQPIAQALLHGEPFTGISLHFMERRVDAGRLLAQDVVPILDKDTVYSLSGRIFELGGRILIDVIERLANGTSQSWPQDEKRATYFKRLHPDAGRIDWSQNAVRILRRIRLAPWLEVFTTVGRHKLLILAAEAEQDASETAPPVGFRPGQIVYRRGNALVVLCGEGRIVLTGYKVAGPRLGRRKARRQLRAGTILG